MSDLNEAISKFGRARLAESLGVTKAAISQWFAGDKPAVPIERCVQIERITEGAITRKQMRPDDWREIWPELAA